VDCSSSGYGCMVVWCGQAKKEASGALQLTVED